MASTEKPGLGLCIKSLLFIAVSLRHGIKKITICTYMTLSKVSEEIRKNSSALLSGTCAEIKKVFVFERIMGTIVCRPK